MCRVVSAGGRGAHRTLHVAVQLSSGWARGDTAAAPCRTSGQWYRRATPPSAHVPGRGSGHQEARAAGTAVRARVGEPSGLRVEPGAGARDVLRGGVARGGRRGARRQPPLALAQRQVEIPLDRLPRRAGHVDCHQRTAGRLRLAGVRRDIVGRDGGAGQLGAGWARLPHLHQRRLHLRAQAAHHLVPRHGCAGRRQLQPDRRLPQGGAHPVEPFERAHLSVDRGGHLGRLCLGQRPSGRLLAGLEAAGRV